MNYCIILNITIIAYIDRIENIIIYIIILIISLNT